MLNTVNNKKYNNHSTLLKLVLFLLLPILYLGIAHTPAQAGFGISPSDIVNDHVKPGDYYEKKIIISRAEALEDLRITIDTELDGMEEWFDFDTGRSFIFPKGENRKAITAKIDIPEDAPFNKFNGSIRIKANNESGDVAGVSIVKGAKLNVQLVTTGIDVTNLLVRTMSIEDVDDGEPVTLAMLIENTGNVDIGPSKVELNITDLNNNLLETLVTSDIDSIPVGETNVVNAEFLSELDPGEYFGIAKVYLGENVLLEENLFFRIDSKVIIEEAEPSITEQVVTESQYPFITDNLVYMLAVIVVIILILLIILIAVRKRKDNESKFRYVVYLVGVLFVVLLLSLLATIFLNNQVNTTKTIIKSEVTPQDNMDGEEYIEEVKGAATEYFAEPVNTSVSQSTLIVIPTSSPELYPIYKENSTLSEVIYSATDGETLDVMQDIDEWYQVRTESGVLGWVEKIYVKSNTTQ